MIRRWLAAPIPARRSGQSRGCEYAISLFVGSGRLQSVVERSEVDDHLGKIWEAPEFRRGIGANFAVGEVPNM